LLLLPSAQLAGTPGAYYPAGFLNPRPRAYLFFLSSTIRPPPAGCVAGLPAILTGLHWFVHSMATPMRFTLIQAGQPPVQGLALAHMEKNWGQSFPSRWHWAQGLNVSSGSSSCSSDGADGSSGGGSSSSSCGSNGGPHMQAAFALAGGKLPLALLPEGLLPDLWLLGVRTGNRRQAAEDARWQQWQHRASSACAWRGLSPPPLPC
jgi:hypothetical protein